MDISKEDAEKMDMVLEYLISNPDARVKPKQIQEILKTGFDEAKHIYESILAYHQQTLPIITTLNADNLAARPDVTSKFINDGGFKLVYKMLSSEGLNVESVKKVNKTNIDWQRKTYWITFGLAVAGFIMGLAALLISLKIFE